MSSPQMITLEQATWAWIDAGAKKHKTDILTRYLKAFQAGYLLSFGGTLVQIMTANPWFTTNAPGLLKILQGLVFPLGLVMIVLFQADLVTGQMAIMIMSTMKRKVPFWAWFVDWTLVFIGNMSGALFYAGIVVHYGGIYTPAISKTAAAAADMKAEAMFHEIFLRGIGCNYAVVAAVFMASLAKDVVSKIFAAYLPIFFFVAAGYDHVVANMFLIPEGLMTDMTNFSVGRYIGTSIVASFLGNVVGAALLVVPLVYIHGRDEYDPSNLEVADGAGSSSPAGTVAGGHQLKNAEWRDDVERAAASKAG